jgi:hypothetical protein
MSPFQRLSSRDLLSPEVEDEFYKKKKSEKKASSYERMLLVYEKCNEKFL